jgi:hypothetical protein
MLLINAIVYKNKVSDKSPERLFAPNPPEADGPSGQTLAFYREFVNFLWERIPGSLILRKRMH